MTNAIMQRKNDNLLEPGLLTKLKKLLQRVTKLEEYMKFGILMTSHNMILRQEGEVYLLNMLIPS